jgi:hypothetical protein
MYVNIILIVDMSRSKLQINGSHDLPRMDIPQDSLKAEGTVDHLG